MDDILVDAGLLISAMVRQDQYHSVCSHLLRQIDKPLITTLPALTEALYFCQKHLGWVAQSALLSLVKAGDLELYQIAESDFARVIVLMEKYQDLPMDFADASLVVAAEQLNIRRILTTDRRDFSVYRFGKNQGFEILGP
jgi:uncharacterized protein